jgi:signal transduction histidine kinase/DNA-binding response OmpR family regulator/CHASE3 domain sensor protein
MKRGLNFRTVAASLVLCGLVAAVFVVLLQSIENLRDTSRLAADAERAIAASNRVERLMLDLQTGVRGYVITQQERFLEPWESARAVFPRELRRLEQLVGDNPDLKRQAGEIADAGLSYLHTYSEPLVALARRDQAKAEKVVSSGQGKLLVDALRRRFADFVGAEERLSAARRRESADEAHRAVVAGFAGMGAVLLVVLLFSGYISRLVVAPVRRVASAAERLARGDLAARVPESAAAEVGQLARSFNTMASSLEESRDELESQNAELELQTAELEDRQTRLAEANDEVQAQRDELERAMGALTEEKERVELLFAFGEMLARDTEDDRLAANVLRELGDAARAEVGALYLETPDKEEGFFLATTRGIERSRLPQRLLAGRGLAGRALAEQRSVSAARGETELQIESLGGESAPAFELHLPLSVGDRLLGVVSLGRLGGQPFSAEELEALEHLASQASVAVSNVLAFGEARRLGDINRAVLDATLDGISLANSDGEIVLMNATQQRMLGDLFELPPGLTVAESRKLLIDRITEPDRFRAVGAAIEEDPEYEGLDQFDLVSGRSYLRYTGPVRNSGGELLGRIYVTRETTAEREAERLKSELVATVSHELRTPLSSIMGFAELLAQRDYDEDTRRRFLRTIHSEASRLTGLVNDFLDLQRIEAGNFTLTLEPFDVDALVRDEVELYSAQSENHRLELELPDEPVQVIGERDRIAQVLGNLLSNAIKYSPQGGRIRVRLERNEAAAHVSISDEGVGIPAEQQSRVFSKFFRADSSDTREIGGTGLGLALCKEIVEAHSGRIGFTSIEGKGSTFWLELPSSSRTNGHRDGRRLVLVVEDDPSAASLLARYLGEADYAIEVTPTGEDALARVAERRPDAICLDITLAGELDGWAVLSRLKADDATSGIPVVICTAGNGRAEASALGAADFLTKPFAAEQLRESVERVLPGGRGSVLVVDDEETVRALVVETLTGSGYELREAADGEEALERVAARAPDAIVLDLMLPKVDGFEVLERLQADPSTRRIPIIVLTARRLTARERASFQRRAVSLLEKNDYSGEELRSLVAQALG